MAYKFKKKSDVYAALDELISGSIFGDEYLSHEDVIQLVDAVRMFIEGSFDEQKIEPCALETVTDLCVAGRALYDAYGTTTPEIDAYVIMALQRVNDALDLINDADLKLKERSRK